MSRLNPREVNLDGAAQLADLAAEIRARIEGRTPEQIEAARAIFAPLHADPDTERAFLRSQRLDAQAPPPDPNEPPPPFDEHDD